MADKQQSSASTAPAPELSRELSLFHITMMGLGMMIGAGVFLGMGISISKAGPGRRCAYICPQRTASDVYSDVVCGTEFCNTPGRRRIQYGNWQS